MQKQKGCGQTRRRWMLALFAGLLAAAVGWVAFDHLFAPLGKRSMRAEIPNFYGMNAEEVLAADWMELEIVYRYDPEVPAGRVLSQEPQGGSFRKLTAEMPRVPITLVVSLGVERLTLEDLCGWDAREAEARLREQGFGVQTQSCPSPKKRGTVLGMQPDAQALLPRGATVVLTVSEGVPQEVVTVPDLRGLSRSDALVRLWLAQLAVGDVIEVDSDAPSGTVVGQSHHAGTRVKAATKMTLYVSRES